MKIAGEVPVSKRARILMGKGIGKGEERGGNTVTLAPLRLYLRAGGDGTGWGDPTLGGGPSSRGDRSSGRRQGGVDVVQLGLGFNAVPEHKMTNDSFDNKSLEACCGGLSVSQKEESETELRLTQGGVLNENLSG